ncbi:MAG: glycosyl transferase family 11 [Mucilaginibacter sp.]|nr:glycosyl transferase family 11 [Mucilaginibacter sp.]
MILVKLQGGLGNQLFQYAFGCALAARTGQQLYLDITTLQDTNVKEYFTYRKFELDHFPIRAKIADEKILKALVVYPGNRFDRVKQRLIIFTGFVRHIYEPDLSFHGELLESLPPHSFFCGFWQSEKYFALIATDIRRDLTFKLQQDPKNLTFLNLIMNCTAISVHIRRGDYVNNNTHPLCPLSYYRDAIGLLNQRIKNPVYFIFSDDATWVKENFNHGEEMHIVDINSNHSHNDLLLMSKCRHHIIANSSFSWWGAWLNPDPDKLVVVPKKWFYNENTNTADLIPENWIII